MTKEIVMEMEHLAPSKNQEKVYFSINNQNKKEIDLFDEMAMIDLIDHNDHRILVEIPTVGFCRLVKIDDIDLKGKTKDELQQILSEYFHREFEVGMMFIDWDLDEYK